MRTMKWSRSLWTLGGATFALFLAAGSASAGFQEISTERAGSIVVFPKIIYDGTRDTVIQLTNTGNPMAHAHCFYINAAPIFPSLPPSRTNPPQWTETDFDVWLTRQQPTHWVASRGRRPSFTNPDVDGFGKDGAGIDPGLVPPVQVGFTGELKCIQVGDDGGPMPSNKLKGEATLRRRDGDVSTYNAIAFQGNPDLSASQIGNDLSLDLTMNHPEGEYSACPDVLQFDHIAYGAPDPVIQQLGTCAKACTNNGNTCTLNSDCGGNGKCLGNCPVNTTLTLVPCQEDLENQRPGRVTVAFQIFNEFEQALSTSTTVECWMDSALNRINDSSSPQNGPFNFALLGTLTAYTRIHPNPGQGGVIGVAEETHIASNTPGAVNCNNPANATNPLCRNPTLVGANAAFALHTEGNRFDAATDGVGIGVDAGGVNHSLPGVTDHIIKPGE